jgi:hypothetical protein
MAGITYMQRRSSGIYEFRKRLPKELAGKPAPEHAKRYVPELVNPDTGRFKRELTVSLGTNDPKAAKRRDLAEALKAADLFEKATLSQDIGGRRGDAQTGRFAQTSPETGRTAAMA